MPTVDFATFCYEGDVDAMHHAVKRQVASNNYDFKTVLLVYQGCVPFEHGGVPDTGFPTEFDIIHDRQEGDWMLQQWNIDLEGQYASDTDNHHTWKNHVINHLRACEMSYADFIVFADADCWMRSQPADVSWVNRAIYILKENKDVFIVSPNDGEPERKTDRFSQQMFMVRRSVFNRANFNQPGWDGNVHVPGGPFPEYWALLEGRMALYAKHKGLCRYVLGPEFRYWHGNRRDKDGNFETDYSKY